MKKFIIIIMFSIISTHIFAESTKDIDKTLFGITNNKGYSIDFTSDLKIINEKLGLPIKAKEKIGPWYFPVYKWKGLKIITSEENNIIQVIEIDSPDWRLTNGIIVGLKSGDIINKMGKTKQTERRIVYLYSDVYETWNMIFLTSNNRVEKIMLSRLD